MSDSIFVSIILPTYNRGGLIEDCIFSVVRQTYSDFELIILDDCSNDETGSIVLKLSKKDKRIRYFRNENRMGLPGNRNKGLFFAKGNFVFFIEDDMELDPKCIELLVGDISYLCSKGFKVGGITPSIITECKDEYRFGILNEALRKASKKMNSPCVINKVTGVHFYNFSADFSDLQEVPDMHACSFYAKKAILSVGGYDHVRYNGNYLYEETDLNIRISRNGYSFYFEPEAILHHKVVSSGGCKVNIKRYVYYYITNHIKFVTKNYGIRAVYMIPSFLVFIMFIGLKTIAFSAVNLLSSD